MELLRKVLARLLKLKKEAQQENSTLTSKEVKAELEAIKTEIRQKIGEATKLSINIDCTSPEGKKQFKEVCKELKDLFEIDSLLERQIEEYLVNHSLEEKNETISASLIRKIEGPFTRLLNKKLEIEELNNQININEEKTTKEVNKTPQQYDTVPTEKIHNNTNTSSSFIPIRDKVFSQEAIQAMLLANTDYDDKLRECLIDSMKSLIGDLEKYVETRTSPFLDLDVLDFFNPGMLERLLYNPNSFGYEEKRIKQLKEDFNEAAKRLNLEDKPKYLKQVLIEWFRLTDGGKVSLEKIAKQLLPPDDNKNTDKGPQLVLQNPTKGQKKEQYSLQQDVKLVPPQIGGLVNQTNTKPFFIDLSKSGLVMGSGDENDLRFFTWGSELYDYDLDQKLPWTIEINPLETNQNLGMDIIVPGMQFDEKRSKNAFFTIPGATDYQPDLQTLFEPNKQPLEIVQPIYPDNIIPNLDEGTSVLPQQYANLVVVPQMNATLLINQGQMGQIIPFSTLQQQQSTGIFAKAAGAENLRFSSVKFHPQTSFVPKLSSSIGSSTTITEGTGRVVVFPSQSTTTTPITQSSFAKGVSIYMWTRAAFSIANEIGKANGGYQPWSTTGKNLGYIGVGITVGFAISWAAPPVALVLGCGVIVHDVYRFFNPIRPKIKLYKVSFPPLDPGGLMTFSGPLVNKLEKSVMVETLNHITHSSVTPLGKPQICLNPLQPLETRATNLLQQSGHDKAPNFNSQTPFYFSYDMKKSPSGKTSQIRLECKTAHHEPFPYITSTTFLDQENPKPFVMNFSEQQAYPGYINVIYPHPQGKKPYVVMIDVAKQSMGINYHHTRPNENITAYIARTVVPESWLKWKVDPTIVVTIDYRHSNTKPKITAEKSGMEICQPITDLFNYSLYQNNKNVSVKTATEYSKLKTSDIPIILSRK